MTVWTGAACAGSASRSGRRWLGAVHGQPRHDHRERELVVRRNRPRALPKHCEPPYPARCARGKTLIRVAALKCPRARMRRAAGNRDPSGKGFYVGIGPGRRAARRRGCLAAPGRSAPGRAGSPNRTCRRGREHSASRVSTAWRLASCVQVSVWVESFAFLDSNPDVSEGLRGTRLCVDFLDYLTARRRTSIGVETNARQYTITEANGGVAHGSCIAVQRGPWSAKSSEKITFHVLCA